MNDAPKQMDAGKAYAVYQNLVDSITTVITGQEAVIRHLLAAFLTGGHVLLEDYPGTGKTTLAKCLARAVGAKFSRVQFTPDLLPTDILGASIYNQGAQEFVIHKGPIFTNILLADEINRASPRTQSALLEAMAEGQVSLEGQRFLLEQPYCVIATQNPVEFHGTYPLPEAQMDRFALRLSLGYVSRDDEVAIISRERLSSSAAIEPVTTIDDVLAFSRAALKVVISSELKHYLVGLVQATRDHQQVSLGASPRASIALLRCAQALALFDQADFVTPDHIQELAKPALCHRLGLHAASRFSGTGAEAIVSEILTSIPVPR